MGGDAAHSILVKGLDHALLQKNIASLETSTAEELDDELEKAFHAGGASAEVAPAVAKRSREEILAAVKGKRAKFAGVDTPVEAKSSKFKPIGVTEKKKKRKEVGGSEAGESEKKMRKKKKKIIDDSAITTEPKPATSTVGSTPSNSEQIDTAPLSLPPSRPMSKPLIPPPNDDDDGDIFAGAGDYTAEFSDDSKSDDEGLPAPSDQTYTQSSSAAPDRSPSPPSLRQSWFPSVLRSPSPPPPSVGPPPRRSTSRSPSPPAPTRLQGFASSSIPSVKDLLAMDKKAEEEAKRKAKKAAWRAKQGLPQQDGAGSDDERDRKEVGEDVKLNRGPLFT